jgi:hypothetical protein
VNWTNACPTLVVGAADRSKLTPRLRVRWQGRFSHICVDEFQDVDAAPLRLARIVAEPERNLFLGVTTTSRSSEFAHTAPPTHGCRRVRAKIVE